MPLEKYQSKRKFDQTPEPAGKEVRGRGPLRFVIQKHEASRLHYDFRLEFDGVLKSWAVPKGPSLNPEDKRLAMMTEDHPLDYRTFEGIIPEGNYGAGTVMVWDEGTYFPGYVDHDGKVQKTGKNRAEQDKEMRRQLHEQHLTFIVEGKKIQGEFALIKIKNSDDENAWLLIKKGDEHANSDKDVTNQDRSSVSGRTMGEIAEAKDHEWHSNESRPALELSQAPKSKMPHDIKPMLATLVDAPFDREDWIFEIKWDGYRAMAEVENGKVKLYSRNLQSFNQKFAPIANALEGLGHDAVIDGEVVVVDDQGRSRFQLLQNYQKTGEGNIVYYVFDLLWLDGHDLTKFPLIDRKQILEALCKGLSGESPIRISEHIEGRGVGFFAAAKAQELEGIMAKDGQGPYRVGLRSQKWLKIKTHQRQEAVVGGFTDPKGSRKDLGSLVLGVYEGSKLVYIGHTGGGFTDKSLSDMKAALKPLIRKTSPFSTTFKTNAPVTWVKPQMVVEVDFAEWTGDGHLRQPILVGVREDKDPKQVKREVPANTVSAEGLPRDEEILNQVQDDSSKPSLLPPNSSRLTTPKGDQDLQIEGHKLKVTHLDKVYWSDDGYTKGDLINYYHQIAPLILPYLKDRPESLNRHPNGIKGSSFYQKDMDAKQVASWAKTAKVYSESNQKDINFLICNNVATLIYMANLGCIEINPWNSRLQNLEKPDWLVIDLDPENIGFDQVIETANMVHQVLDKAGAASYPKTSGATGLHIYVPLEAKYDYDQAKEFAHLVGMLVNQQLPETTSIERSPAKRQKRVYLDYLQNRHGQTLAAPYSVRPKPGATVSTPLKWEEVKPGLSPSDFTIKNIFQRIDKVGDLWEPVLGKGIDLKSCLENLSG